MRRSFFVVIDEEIADLRCTILAGPKGPGGNSHGEPNTTPVTIPPLRAPQKVIPVTTAGADPHSPKTAPALFIQHKITSRQPLPHGRGSDCTRNAPIRAATVRERLPGQRLFSRKGLSVHKQPLPSIHARPAARRVMPQPQAVSRRREFMVLEWIAAAWRRYNLDHGQSVYSRYDRPVVGARAMCRADRREVSPAFESPGRLQRSHRRSRPVRQPGCSPGAGTDSRSPGERRYAAHGVRLGTGSHRIGRYCGSGWVYRHQRACRTECPPDRRQHPAQRRKGTGAARAPGARETDRTGPASGHRRAEDRGTEPPGAVFPELRQSPPGAIRAGSGQPARIASRMAW